MSLRVTMWIIILIIITFDFMTYDMLHLLDIPLNCVYDTDSQSTKKRSIVATDGFPAAWFTGRGMRHIIIGLYVIPFFTKDSSQLEPLMRWVCEEAVNERP